MNRRFATTLLTFICLASCSRIAGPDDCGTPPGGDGDPCKVSVSLDFPGSGTKSLLSDENLDTGFSLFVFDHSTGSFVTGGAFPSRSGGTVMLVPGVSYDFYVVGNLHYVSTSGGTDLPYGEFAGLRSASDFPYYVFNGAPVASGYRNETFAEFATYGIPYSGYVNGTPGVGTAVSISVARLFARIDVTLNHAGVVGDGMSGSVFTNGTLHVRQANARIHPFVTDVAAASDADLVDGDCDSVMSNGASESFTYYVPENCQGTASGVSSPSGKTPAVKPYATYLEFRATLDGSHPTAGGYGGTVRYQFCPGGNATTDFNLMRGARYIITADFSTGAMFSPTWKVTAQDDWSDTRVLSLVNRNGDFPKECSGSPLVVVRPWGGQDLQVYFHRFGLKSAASNEFQRLAAWDASYSPSDASSSAWKISYDAAAFAAVGVTVTSDTATGGVRLVNDSEADHALLMANLGTELPLTLTLYPGGESTVFTVRLMDELTVDCDDETYMGMSLRVRIGNMAGEPRVFADNPQSVFKTAKTLDAPYLGATKVPVAREFDLYAYGHGLGTCFNVTSDDPFNDDEGGRLVDVYRPTVSGSRNATCLVPVDGTEVEAEVSFLDRSDRKIEQERFDPDLFSQFLASRVTFGSDVPSFIRKTDDGRIYMYWTSETESMLNDSTVYYVPEAGHDDDSLSVGKAMADMGHMTITPVNSTLYPYSCGVALVTARPSLRPFDIQPGSMYNSFPADTARVSGGGSATCDREGCETVPQVVYFVDSGSDGTLGTLGQVTQRYSDGTVYYEYGIDHDSAVDLYGESTRNYLDLPYGDRRIALTFQNKWSHQGISTGTQAFRVRQQIRLSKCPVRKTSGGQSFVALRPALCGWVYRQWALEGLPLWSVAPFWRTDRQPTSEDLTVPFPYVSTVPKFSQADPPTDYGNKAFGIAHVDEQQAVDGTNDPAPTDGWNFDMYDDRYSYVILNDPYCLSLARQPVTTVTP